MRASVRPLDGLEYRCMLKSHDSRETVRGAFFSRLEDLRPCYLKKWLAGQSSLPSVLYHYTSVPAAAAIVRSSTLRATSFRHLNDETEVVHASNVLASVLGRLRQQDISREERLLLAPELHESGPLKSGLIEVFVASLSAREDDLSQWIAYGDRGCGVALGFDTAHLASVAQDESTQPFFDIRKVVYTEAEQTEWLEWSTREWLSRASADFLAHHAEATEPVWFINGLCAYLSACNVEHFPSLKHPKFEVESEWRLVHAHCPDTCTCVVEQRSDGATYLPLSLARQSLPLVSLWLGPGHRNNDAAQESARHFLSNAGLAHVSIRVSEVPLRIACPGPTF